MKNGLSNMIRVVLTVMLLAGVAMSVFWLPDFVNYLSGFFAGETENASIKYFIYAYFAVIELPLFAVLVMAFKFPPAIENDAVFTRKTAATVKSIALIILSDCILFFIGTVTVFALGEKLISPVFAVIFVIGVTVSLMLLTLSHYLGRAAVLKEEADYTL